MCVEHSEFSASPHTACHSAGRPSCTGLHTHTCHAYCMVNLNGVMLPYSYINLGLVLLHTAIH